MSAPEMKSTLAKIEKMLAQVVGVQKMRLATPAEFLQHALAEITKAQSEPTAKSRIRLSLLHKSVLYTSACIEDVDADNIKVPIFVCDQTTLAEQENTVTTPEANAKLNNGNGKSFFENGVMKAIAELEAQMGELIKAEDEEEEDDDPEAEKAKKADDEEEEDDPEAEKAKKADDEEEDDDEAKAKKPPMPPTPPKPPGADAKAEKRAKKKLAKNAPVEWPKDMNDEKVEKKSADEDWGSDR